MNTAIDNLRGVGIASVLSSGNDVIGQHRVPGLHIDGSERRIDLRQRHVWSLLRRRGQCRVVLQRRQLRFAGPGQLDRVLRSRNGYDKDHGTSMAAPHVAGAWAALDVKPTISVSDALIALRDNGLTLSDTRSGGQVTGMKRLDMAFIGVGSHLRLTVAKADTVGDIKALIRVNIIETKCSFRWNAPQCL